MSKIIIDYDGLNPQTAVDRVKDVINGGRISEAGGLAHYCWYTTWPDGVSVMTRRKRTENSADSFVVTRATK